MTTRLMTADGGEVASRAQMDSLLNASRTTAALLGQHAHGVFQTP